MTETIPFSLARAVGTETFTPSTLSWDLAIGDQPFLYATNDQRPYQRQFVQLKKQQFDNSTEPGEQTLDNVFWLRSQSTFTGGAGRDFLETASRTQIGLTDPFVRTQFHSSMGVDTWTDGKVQLLKGVSKVADAGTKATVASIIDSGGRNAYIYYSTALGWATKGGTVDGSYNLTALPVTVPAGTTQILTVGDQILYGHPLGISVGTVSVGAAALWTQAAATPPQMWWVKQRMVFSVDNILYTGAISGASAAISTATKLWTHPVASWRWTSVTEAPGAILAAGYSGTHSAVYKFTLGDDGILTVLTSGATTAEMPTGEIVYAINVYLGTFIALGTSRGVRIGQVNESGQVAYGPLTIDTGGVAVKCLLGQDRFMYAGCTNGMPDGTSGLYRIDLSNIDTSGRAAWGYDISSGANGAVTSITTFGATSQLAFSIGGVGHYLNYASRLESTGYLRTAFVRYSTLEPKHFLYAKVRTPEVLGGALAVSTVEGDGDVVSILTIGEGGSNVDDLTLNRNETLGEERLGLRFDFTRNTVDLTDGPELNGWQLKATPALDRQRQLSFWVFCQDFESDRFGARTGGPGTAYTRFQALEDYVSTGRRTRFTDFRTGESLTVVVDDVQFVSLTPPGNTNTGNFGGFLQVALRTI